MIRQLVASYVALVAVAITVFTVPVAFVLTGQLRDDTEGSARREAQTAALLLAGQDEPSHQALARLVEAYGEQTPGRLDVLSSDGTAVAPLALPPAPGDEAFRRALAGETVSRWGEQAVLGADGLVVAVPVRDGAGEVIGAVRVTYPSAPLNNRLVQIWGFRAAMGVSVLAVAALLGVLLARRLTRPLRTLNRMAARLGDGDLTVRAQETGPLETRTLARTLNNATEQIDALIGSQRAFIADASHQLRTPLTALRLSLDNIAETTDDPALRDDVDQAAAEVLRMSRLVNGLLALARAEVEAPAPEPVDVADVVAERFGTWRAAADEKRVSLAFAARGPAPVALVTPGHLEQVLDNLLANSLDVAPPGSTVTVGTAHGDGRVALTVADEGPGIAPELRQRAFDRFWRGENRVGGTGLGLAIVKRLVTDDDGGIALGEAPGGGLVVRITLLPAPPRINRLSPRGTPTSGG